MKTIQIHPAAICESDRVGVGTRLWAYSHVMRGAVIGAECNIGEGVFVEDGALIGDRVTVKNHALIWRGVQIDDDVFIGPSVIFTNDRNPRSPRMSAVAERYERADTWCLSTCVRRGASVGAGAIILPGISIGEYAVIGAGSLITRNVAAHQIVFGNPARPHGWACICGCRLADNHICLSCGRNYRLSVNELVLQRAD